MKAFAKRCLAVLLSITMVLTMLPASSYAEEDANTYVKISSKAELTTGKYVMVVSSGYAAGSLDSGWLTATLLSATNGMIMNPDSNLIWSLDVSDSGVVLTDANGTAVKPKGGNNNGIFSGEYIWNVEETGGTFLFKGTGTDTVTLASNTDSQYENKFRAYKNTTVADESKYPTKFTLYKLTKNEKPEEPSIASKPTAIPASGEVASGTAITISCETEGAKIQYTTASPAAIWIDYAEPIIINQSTTIYAKATADGQEESEVAIFNYVIKDEPTNPDLFDPITTIPDGAHSIVEANNALEGPITVVGQLIYRFGNYDQVNSAILEDVINGQIEAIQIYDSLDEYQIGDVLKLTGTKSLYGGVPQLMSITEKEVLTKAIDTQLIPVQEFSTINDVKAAKNSLISEKILLKNVTLDTYNNNGSTKITDDKGGSINIYRAASYPSGVEAGEKVDLYACVSKYNTTDQLRVGASTDYVVTNDTKAPSITIPNLDGAEIGKDYKVSVSILDNVAATEATLTYTINTTPVKISMTQNASDKTKWEAIIPGSTFTKDFSKFTISILAKDMAGNEATSETKDVLVVDEPQIIKVTPERNEATGDVKKPLISISCTNLGENPTATLTVKKEETVVLNEVSMSYADGVFAYTPSENFVDARYTAVVVISRKDGKVTTYEWPFIVGSPNYHLYFGQLHSHTTYSDGAGSLDSALDYINNISESDNIDFVAFTDHSNYFDTKTEVNPEGGLYDKSLMTAESQKLWDGYKNKIADFNNSKTNKGIIAIGGFEMTWSGGPGHMNTFNSPGIVSRNNATLNNKTADAGLKAYYSLLSQAEGANTISQFNHPGNTFGTFADFAYWDPIIDSRIDLVEVGNGEGVIGKSGYYPSYSYYNMALDKGWHVAPTNNQDNHKGKWGNANDARDVIITDNFTEQGIYDALKAHRVYASEDKNLEITYTVNNELMGSIIDKVPEKLDIDITLNDADDEIEKAELIANSGRVVYTWDVNDKSKALTATLTPDYSYYYVRVIEKDKDIAVTAPVWVGDTVMLGISNVESSTSTPVTNEEMKVKTTLFNSEQTDAVIKSLTYKLDGEVLSQVSDAGTVAKSTNFICEYNFTPTAARLQKITVEAVLTLNGIDYSFTKDLELDVRDADKLVYVGIDGSHYNEYVSGNYKDSMGNFSNLAAQSNVRCVILNTSDELLAAAKNENGKYSMLVLTAPSRRNGTALRKPYANYTDAEIKAIKEFSEAGGTLVLCGWSDYYEKYEAFPAEDHMAAQQNKLLKEIGASLRISDDGTNDDTLNGGQTQRLYLSTYNWDNFLTERIIYNKDYPNDNKYSQLFSHYGGASIYAVDKDGNPTETLPNSVSPIVYGHSSTYSKDSDNDGLGGNSIPKYVYSDNDSRLMILASETLTHANGKQSLVVVDGAAFMSNFEIQAKVEDTNAELNYSNYTILENLIQHLNPIQIDKIADVQKEVNEGVAFTVEGIVTSNASGYDKNTAFFDCIYVQDDSAGINAFPVAGDFKVGQKVRITGTTSSYQAERQIKVSNVTLVDKEVTKVEPKEVTAKEINDKTYLGSLVKLSGTVESFEIVNGAVQTIIVKDSKGNEARIFIDGYITTDKEIKNLEKGSKITAVGLSSYDDTFNGLPARIRIRDRADIVCTKNDNPSTPDNPYYPGIPGNVEKPDKPTTPDTGKVVVMEKAETVTTEIETKEVTATEKNGAFYTANGIKIINAIVKTEDGKRYIVDKDGEKYVSSIIQTANGNQYIASDKGAVITGSFVKVNGERFYTTKNTGKVVTDKLIKVDGNKYYATETGAFATGKIVNIDGNKYYTTKNTGKVVADKIFKLDGKKYIAEKSGKLVTSKWVTVDGKEYYCNEDGVVTKTK